MAVPPACPVMTRVRPSAIAEASPATTTCRPDTVLSSGASVTVSGCGTAITVTCRGVPKVWISPARVSRVTLPDTPKAARDSSARSVTWYSSR